jgi:hypothetical protein
MVRQPCHNIFALLVDTGVQNSSGALIFTRRKSELQQNFTWEMSRKYILTEKRMHFVATGVGVKNITLKFYFVFIFQISRSQWPRGLRRGSAAARLLGVGFRIPPGAWMSVCRKCCMLSGRGFCRGPIIRAEESYRMCCVAVCDLETSRMRRQWPELGLFATWGAGISNHIRFISYASNTFLFYVTDKSFGSAHPQYLLCTFPSTHVHAVPIFGMSIGMALKPSLVITEWADKFKFS